MNPKYGFLRKAVCCALVPMVLSVSAPCFAEYGQLRKLGRGLANIGTGFIEIPKNVVIVTDKEGWLAGATYGVVKGFAWAVMRTAAGFYETATFWLECPKGNAPLIEPEFIMGEEY